MHLKDTFHTLYFMNLWVGELEIAMHYATTNRESFLHEVETYKEWAFLCCEAGYFWFKMGAGAEAIEGECHPGEWLLCPPGEPLRRRILSPLDFQVARFRFDNEPDLRGKITPRDFKRTSATLAALRQCCHQPNAISWKSHLFQDLIRSALWEQQQMASFTARDAEMERLAAWLEGHLEQKISMAQVAATARLSPVAFTRRFRAAIGQNPSEYLLQKRLERARTFLLEGDDTIDHIAGRCGLSNGFYLSRQWKLRFGGTPSRFRRDNRV